MNKQFFTQNQKLLLQLVNSEAGRFLLGIKGKYPIIKLSPNSYHQLVDFVGGKPLIKAKFWTYNHVSLLLLPTWMKVEIARREYQTKDNYEAFLHYSGLEEKNYKYPQIYLTTWNVAAKDGTASNADADWATSRTAGTGDSVENGVSDAYVFAQATNYYIRRAFLPVDTSSAGAGMVASAGQLDFVVLATGGAMTGHAVQSSQDGTVDLVTSDFGLITFTSGGSVSAASTGAKTITLNATGYGWFNPTGYTKIALIDSKDQDGTTPTDDLYFNIGLSENATPANRPTMTFTYAPGPGGKPIQGGGLFLI